MNRLLVSEDAVSDAEDILSYLHREAGLNVAAHYARRFDAMVRQLIEFPESGVARVDLGSNCRVAVIRPYILIYDYVREDSLLVVLRILHGHRDISERVLRR